MLMIRDTQGASAFLKKKLFTN